MPIKIKDHDKCKEWERRRRDRLNDAFKNLAQLLPHYDPAKIPAKIDILEKSTEFVKELRLSNSRLLSNQAETDEKCKLIKELQDEVNKLILRVKQLTILLKKANITIPTGPEIKSLGNKRHKWSGRLKPEDVENAVMISTASFDEKSSSLSEKANTGQSPTITVSETELTSTVPSVSTHLNHNGVTTNNTAISTSVASIIVPLKEANLTRSTEHSTTSTSATKANATEVRKTKVTTGSIIISKPCQTSPTTTTTVTASPSILSSPAKLITTPESFFSATTTTPLQLPVQTFIITPCPITGTAQATALPTQNPQIVTRIANILPTPILPKSFESLSLQKIPIKSLLKPIPKVIKRRKRKKKNVALPETAIKQKSEGASTDKVQNETIIAIADSVKDSNSKKITDSVTLSPPREKAIEVVAPLPAVTKDSSSETASNKENTTVPAEELKNKVPEDIVTSPPTPVLVNVEEEQDNGNKEQVESRVKESVTNSNTEKSTESETDVNEGATINLLNAVNKVVKPDQSVNVIIIHEANSKSTSSEKEATDDTRLTVTETEQHPPEDIPVLRIIEASSSSEGTSTDILSAIHVENGDDIIKTNFQDAVLTTEAKTAVNEAETRQLENMQVDDDILEIPVHPDPIQTANEVSPVPKETQSDILEPIQPPPPPTAEIEAKINEASQSNAETESIGDIIPKQLEVFEQAATNQPSSTNSLQNKQMIPPLSPVIEKPVDSGSEGIICTLSESQPTDTASTTAQIVDGLAEIDVQMKSIQAAPAPLAPLENLSLPAASETPVLTSLDKEKDISSKEKGSARRESATTTRHKDMMDTSMSTTDKISECIARSIDLIDANDSELMELGEHWEDTGASPKSISPTQIFLNIFPLLPRESSASESQQQQSTSAIPSQQPQNPTTTSTSQASKNALPFLPSSNNSRSSFFIDAMLPEDHSESGGHAAIVNDSTDLNTLSAHSPFLPLTPPQYSSNIVNQQISNPFSLPNNYYWTPPTVSSSNNTEISATESRSSSNSNFSQSESYRSSANSSMVGTTATSTFSTASTTKTSTTTTQLLTPVFNPPASVPSVVSNKSSSKRSKSTASSSSAGKLAFNFDTSTPAFSKSKSLVTSTSTKTTTPTTISVTWTLTGPTSTQTSTFHPSTATPFHNTSETNVHFSSTNSSVTSNSQVSHHSCSLLDSLNPMDAAFFRPLMNALDSHDFRSLDFSGNNSLPPPPPPLPSLIPPPPSTCKSLYPPQFGTNSQPVQNSVSSNTGFLDHSASSASIQGPFIHHHHHQPVQMFGNNLQQLAAPESIIQSSASTSAKHQSSTQTQQQQQNLANVSQINQKLPPANDGAKATSGSDKTSRTSGRQKSESAKTKKERSGKSSRTQPYTVASSHTSGTTDSNSNNKLNQGQRFEQMAPVATTQKSSHSYPFHTIQSHINPCFTKPTGTHSSRSHDMENLHSSLHFETTEMQNFSKMIPPVSGNHSSHNVERAQGPKTSESKSHKSKEEKLHSYNSSKVTKQSAKSSRNDFALSTPSSSSSQSLNTVRPSNSQGKNAETSSQTTATIRTSTQPETAKTTMQNTQLIGNAELLQPFQTPHSALEPFQLFPEFNAAGANSRQFSAPVPVHSHQYPTHENSTQSMPLQRASSSADQLPATSNFNVQPVQRSHPYYFPDITSTFGENFQPVPVHQPQPQSHLSTYQVLNSGNKQSTSNANANSAHSIQGLSQGTDNASKFTYMPHSANITQSQQTPVAQVPSSHQEYHQIHVSQQQQKSQRHHHNSNNNNPFAHHPSHSCNQQVSVQTSAASNQQATNQRHHAQQPCQQVVSQSQNRNHHSQTSTVTTSTASTAPVSSGKGKQQIVPPTSFHTSLVTQQQQHQQTASQHHQQVQLQNTHQHHQQQQQNVSQSHHHHNRSSSSKTVNWMTDSGYRPSNSASTSSSSSASSKHQQRQNSSASNPFSVSKLVGSSTASTSSKPHQPTTNSADAVVNTRGQQQLQVQPLSSQNCGHNANVARSNKSARNTGTANSLASVPPASNNQTQNQSSYCAEALIRKNPPVPQVDWANEFNLVPPPTNQGIQAAGYTSTIGHHHSNTHTHHQHHSAGSEHFPNYANPSYQYPTGGESHVSSSSSSQFTHFDQSQYHVTQHQHHHQQQTPTAQSMSINNYNTTAQSQSQRQHNPQSSQNQSSSGQIHYSHQHHYPHHSSHHPHHQQHNHGSTSSVTNFNLSTIFPEINDKRNNNALGGGHGRSVSGNNSADVSSRASGAGNMNSACSYHHSSFTNQTSGNLH